MSNKKSITAKSAPEKVVADYLAPIDHDGGLYHPKFLWTRMVNIVNGVTGAIKYVAQFITESYSEINIVFDREAGEIWLAAKPRYNVLVPSKKVDTIRLKGAQEMAKLLNENEDAKKNGKPIKPVPSFGSVMDALTGPLAQFLGKYARWEIIRGWTSEKLAESMEESGKMVDVKKAVRIGDVNGNTALFSTYLPVYLVPIIKDQKYTGPTPDDAAEIIGARGFKPEELRQLILGKGQFAKDGAMICGLSLAALQLFTMWALEEADESSPEFQFAANL